MRSFWRLLTLAAATLGGWAWPAAVPAVEKQAHGVLVRLDAGALRLEVWSDRVVRVTYAQGAEIPAIHSLSVIPAPAAVLFEIQETRAAVDLSTRALRAHVTRVRASFRSATWRAGRSSKRRVPANPAPATALRSRLMNRFTAWASTRTVT